MKRKAGDAWLNESRPRTSPWERALRPAGASRWLLVLLLLAAGVFLALAVWTAMQDSRRPAPDPRARQAASPAAGSRAGQAAAPTLAPAPSQARDPRTQQISKCTSRAGSATYSDGPCPSGTFASVLTLRPDTNLAEGMSPEARQASISRNATVAQGTAPYEQQVALNVDRADAVSDARCRQLDAWIAAIDAAARQPQSGVEQDRLKAERMRLRDRQFALRCA